MAKREKYNFEPPALTQYSAAPTLSYQTLLTLVDYEPKKANFLVEFVKDRNAARAAAAMGLSSELGYQIRDELEATGVIDKLIEALTHEVVDKEWLLVKARDTYTCAMQAGQYGAANGSLKIIGQHADIDAFAADKVQMGLDETLVDRLRRGRERALNHKRYDADECSYGHIEIKDSGSDDGASFY